MDKLITKAEAATIVSSKLGLSFRHVYDRIMPMPDFPRPVVLPSSGSVRPPKRYHLNDVRGWLLRRFG